MTKKLTEKECDAKADYHRKRVEYYEKKSIEADRITRKIGFKI